MRLKIFTILGLFLISFSVFSDTYTAISGFYYKNYFSAPHYDSYAAACQGSLATTYTNAGSTATLSGIRCTAKDNTGYPYNAWDISSISQSTCPGGGTLSGSDCINAPACVAPQVRNATTGICGAPPPEPCPPINTAADIGVKQADAPRVSDGMLTIGISSYNDESLKAVKDGAEYSYTPADYAGECYNKTDGVYCNYHAKSTGVCNVATSDAIAPSTGTAQANSKNGQCLTDPKGNTLCRDNPEGNRNCGLVNGSKICVDAATGTGTVNGQPYQTSAKNCGYVNGDPVCVSDTDGSATTVGCVKNGGVQQCVNHDVKKDGNTTVTTNPNGTVTTTTIITTNIIGRPDEITTKTCDSAGNCTTQVSGGDNGQLSGVEKGLGKVEDAAKQAECDKPGNAGTAGCTKLETTAPTPDTITTTAVPTTMTIGAYSPGSCPAPQSISLSRGQYSLSNQPLCDMATGTKPLLVAMAYLAAGYIVLGQVRGE